MMLLLRMDATWTAKTNMEEGCNINGWSKYWGGIQYQWMMQLLKMDAILMDEANMEDG